MFDMVSLIREKIFRQPKIKVTAGEELSEKQTTKLGYFLLYCMFWAILMSAQWTLSIFEEIPSRPQVVPSCIENLLSPLKEWSDNYSFYENEDNYIYPGYNNCDLTSENPVYDFSVAYNKLKPIVKQIDSYGERINTLENEKTKLLDERSLTQSEYNTALTEKLVWENQKVYNTNITKKELTEIRTTIDKKDSEIIILKKSIDTIRQSYLADATALKAALEQAEKDYTHSYLIYRLIVGILSLIFAIVVFAILYRYYVRYKTQNHPNAIIFSVATFAYGLVLLEIVCLFLWDIIPHKIWELLLSFFAAFTPLLYLVQFLWPILIIAVFGFLVFRIQKRLYSPENILKRFITDKKCPNCGNGVDLTKDR